MRFILDSTVIRSGMQISGQDEWYTTQSVMNELKKGRAAKDAGLLADIYLIVLMPGKENRKLVETLAKQTGDIDRLSDTDLDVLALALELEATIVSDDYSIQNVANQVNVNFASLMTYGIRFRHHWIMYCPACYRKYSSDHHNETCQVCGTRLKRKPLRKTLVK